MNFKMQVVILSKCQSLSFGSGARKFTCGKTLSKKKDLYREDKLPIFDYGRVNLDNRRIYTFGAAFHGGLGLRNLLKPTDDRHRLRLYMNKPVRNEFSYNQDVRDIAAGHGFTLIGVARQYPSYPSVFGCGSNHLSQIGFQSARANCPMSIIIAPVGISMPIQSLKPQILALGAGRGHSVVSIKNEGLMLLGCNSSGQCGRYVVDNEEYFGSRIVHRIPNIGGSISDDTDEVTSIAARYDLTVCVTQKGKVFAFGDNLKGQLGRGKDIIKTWDTSQPVGGAIEKEVIVKASTNGNTVLVLNDKGELFGWGCNERGHMIPNKICRIFYEPVPITIKGIGKIIDIALGESTTHLVTDTGFVYTWGQGPMLGLGPAKTLVRKPTLMPPPLFGNNELNTNVHVTSVVAGAVHAAAITNLGDVYTWGKDEAGCLGLGDLACGYQYFPLKVILNSAAIKVALGMDHTVVLTKGGF